MLFIPQINNNMSKTFLLSYKVNLFYFKQEKQTKKISNIIFLNNLFILNNFLFFSKNKILFNNIKKLFYFRLLYFFFKKNFFYSFWLFKVNFKNKSNRVFIFNLFRLVNFKDYFFNKIFMFNFISYFFFNKNNFFNYNAFGFDGFLKSSSICYTRLHFKRILSLQDLSSPKHSLKFSNSKIYFYQKKFCKFLKFKGRPPRSNSKFYDLKYLRYYLAYLKNVRKNFTRKVGSVLQIKNSKYLEFLDKYYYHRRKPTNYYSFNFRSSFWQKKNKSNKHLKFNNNNNFNLQRNKFKFKSNNKNKLWSKNTIKNKNYSTNYSLIKKPKKKEIVSDNILNNIKNISVNKNLKFYLINFDYKYFNFSLLDYFFYSFNNFTSAFSFLNLNTLVLNYINKFFFFWLALSNYNNKFFKSKEKNRIKKKSRNLNYFSISLVKTKYLNNNNFLTKYNVIKFYKYIFNDLFYNNFYRYSILNFIKKKKYFTFNSKENMHINSLNNISFNSYLFIFLPLINTKKRYFNYFTFWQALPIYNLSYFLKNNFYVIYLKNLLFGLKNDYINFFCSLINNNVTLTLSSLFKLKNNNIKLNAYKYNKVLFNISVLRKKINTFLSLSDKISNNILVKLNLIKKFYKVPSYDSYAIPFLKRKIYRFWKHSSRFWNKFFYISRNYYSGFYARLLSIKKSFKFLLFINSKFKHGLIFKKKKITLFSFKKFHYYLININRLFLILSGSTSLFNFFNFISLLGNNMLNFNILNFRLPFKKIFIFLKYIILKKKNLLSFNKNNNFIQTKLAAYKYLFLSKSKFIKSKNNFRNFIKKYRMSYYKFLARARFFNYSSKSLYGVNFLKKINIIFFEMNNDIEDYFAYRLNMSYWSEYLIVLLSKLNLLKINDNYNEVNNNFYNNYYYKYKQLFFFFFNKTTNTSLLDTFNFSLFLYNKNYNWFFFNYFWKFYFINYVISSQGLNKQNIISDINIKEQDSLLYSNFVNNLQFNSNFLTAFNFFNFKNMSKFNKAFIIIKFILKKKLSFFDKSFWNNLIYVKFKKSNLLKRIGKYYPKLNAFSKQLSFNFFNRKKRWRKRYLINVRNYSFLNNINKRKLLLLNKLVILVINIQLNNTFITLTDIFGNVLLKASAGLLGIKGPKRSTPVATEEITSYACQFILKNNYKFLLLRLNGVLQTRKMKSAIKALSSFNNDFIILRAYNYTPKAHNGIRFKKRKRL